MISTAKTDVIVVEERPLGHATRGPAGRSATPPPPGVSSRLWQLWNAVRAPLVLGATWLVVARSGSFLRALVIFQSRDNPFHHFFCAPLHTFFRLTPAQHDCFLYLPISFWSLQHQRWLGGYVMILIGWLSTRAFLRRHDGPGRCGWKTWLLTVVLAVWPWLVVLEGPRARLLPVLALLSVMGWLFIVLNLNVATVTHTRWAARLAEWTFPISDLGWFTFHQQRMGPKAGWRRFVPILSVLIALSAIMISQRGTLAAPVTPLTLVEVFDPHQAHCDEAGCWFAETVGHGAGLRRYDAGSRLVLPIARAQDLRSFVVSGEWVYLYDGFGHALWKVHPETRRPVWQVHVPGGDEDVVEVVGGKGLVFAVASSGSVIGIDPDGRVRVDRRVPAQAWYPQAMGTDRVAVVSPDTLELRTVAAEPSDDVVVPLPIPEERARWRSARSADIPVIVGTAYAERPDTLYVATSWGDILRYEVATRRWGAPLRRPPGIGLMAYDGVHRVLCVYHRVGGYLDLLDAASGTRIARTTASVFGNALSVNPTLQRAMLSARAPGSTSLPAFGGLYELRYEGLVRPPEHPEGG